MKEEETPPTTTESPPKAAEPVEDEGESSTGVGVVTGAPTQPVPGPLVAVGAEWVAGAAEITAHLLVVAITRSPRVRGLAAGTVRIGPSITQPGPGTEAKPAARVQSMRKSPRDGGREVQRLAVRAVQVTSVTRTRKTTRNPTPRTALIMPTPLAAATCHLHHPEVPRPGSSPPGVFPPGGAGVEAVVGATSTGVVAMSEEHQGDTGLDPAQALTVGPPSHQPQHGNSKVRHKPLGLKTWAGEVMVERRRTR